MRQVEKPLPSSQEDPRYPDSDGKPMAEDMEHVLAIIWLFQALEDLLAGRTDVYLAANGFFYYWRDPSGKRYRRVSPDVLAALGVGGHRRRSYRLWEEGVPPRVLFEISSGKTWRRDLGFKRELYAQLGVMEYFLFDPDHKFLDPPLQGFRLENGVSVPIPPNADGRLTSRELGARLTAEGGMLRLRDARTGRRILTRAEQVERAQQRATLAQRRATEESRRATEESRRVAALEAENARLLAELERLRRGGRG